MHPATHVHTSVQNNKGPNVMGVFLQGVPRAPPAGAPAKRERPPPQGHDGDGGGSAGGGTPTTSVTTGVSHDSKVSAFRLFECIRT